MKSVADRFLSYVAIDTQSAYQCKTVPSTEKQKDLGRILEKELKELGLENVVMADNACVYGTLPANYENCKAPAIGFCSHIDTTPEVSGTNVKARIVEKYDGGDIVLNEQHNIIMRADKFPHLKNYIGHDLVVTDGTTLLGADDKAGLTVIMNMLAYLNENPSVKHGEIQIFFPCDEEVGCCGTKQVDLTKFRPQFAYTLDYGGMGKILYECFNGCTANVRINGINFHPGNSKNLMKNSILIAKEFLNMLPEAETPAHTEKYEGYYHVLEFNGEVERTDMKFYLRDHDKNKFNGRKERIGAIAEYLNGVYGDNTVTYEINNTYRNMAEAICPHMEIVKAAEDALRLHGIEPKYEATRGGTDGAILSFAGIPCPNLSEGSQNSHSVYEYVSIQAMEKMTFVIVDIIKKFAN